MKRLLILTTARQSSILSLVFLSLFVVGETFAQVTTEFQYAAKLVCGKLDDTGIAAPGHYFTIINVHNPSSTKPVDFRKRFARAFPGEKAGDVSRFFDATLKPNEAMGIDCPNIYQHTGMVAGTPIEGYVLIHSPTELDVVSVYTAGAREVQTLHTERVPFRRVEIPPCSDLDRNLSTGVNWRVIGDQEASTVEPRPAVVLNSHPGNWSAQSGANWIGPKSTAGTTAPSGRYTYEITFCLCEGYKNPELRFSGWADDTATIYLNNNVISSGFAYNGTPVNVFFIAPFLFHAGTNVIKVEVDNTFGGPTGLNLSGSIRATGGACQTRAQQ